MRVWRVRLRLARASRALAGPLSSSSVLRRPLSTATEPHPVQTVSEASSSVHSTSPVARGDALALLEKSIAQQAPTLALAYFDRLEAPPEDRSVLQRLALLVAKRGRRHEVPRAVELLRDVLRFVSSSRS